MHTYGADVYVSCTCIYYAFLCTIVVTVRMCLGYVGRLLMRGRVYTAAVYICHSVVGLVYVAVPYTIECTVECTPSPLLPLLSLYARTIQNRRRFYYS